MNLLDTSTTWVDIFWMSLNPAKEAFQECIVFLMMEYVSLKWRFHYLLYMLTAPKLIFVLCCKNGTSMRT